MHRVDASLRISHCRKVVSIGRVYLLGLKTVKTKKGQAYSWAQVYILTEETKPTIC